MRRGIDHEVSARRHDITVGLSRRAQIVHLKFPLYYFYVKIARVSSRYGQTGGTRGVGPVVVLGRHLDFGRSPAAHGRYLQPSGVLRQNDRPVAVCADRERLGLLLRVECKDGRLHAEFVRSAFFRVIASEKEKSGNRQGEVKRRFRKKSFHNHCFVELY